MTDENKHTPAELAAIEQDLIDLRDLIGQTLQKLRALVDSRIEQFGSETSTPHLPLISPCPPYQFV